MNVKILLAASDRTIEAEVDESALTRAVAGGAGWLDCTDAATGWAYQLNLAQVVRIERAAS